MIKRFVAVAVVFSVLLALPATAVAMQKLGKYSLVVNHERVPLSASTGYAYKNGQTFMIPIKAVCDKLDFAYEYKPESKSCVIKKPDGAEIVLRAGSRYIAVDKKKYKLRGNNVIQSSSIVTCDIKAVTYLDSGFKHYYASQAKPAGYPSGALVISNDGDLSLPSIPAPVDALPEQLRPAAKTANQIVGVKYQSGSKAILTLYEKINNSWLEQYSTQAFVGRNGIGKTEEGDGKTPTGTFGLSQPFGILSNPGSGIPGYVKVTKYHYWCCTPSSKYYNRLIDIRNVDYSPTSQDERLVKISPEYYYALNIGYNADCTPGLGSAIFLHCKGSAKSTSGCIAVDQNVMRSLIITLDAGAKIVVY